MFNLSHRSHKVPQPSHNLELETEASIRKEVFERLASIFEKYTGFKARYEQNVVELAGVDAQKDRISLKDVEVTLRVDNNNMFCLVVHVPQDPQLIFDHQKPGIRDPIAFAILQITHFIPGLKQALFTVCLKAICHQISDIRQNSSLNSWTKKPENFDVLYTNCFISFFNRLRIRLTNTSSGEVFEYRGNPVMNGKPVIDLNKYIFVGSLFSKIPESN